MRGWTCGNRGQNVVGVFSDAVGEWGQWVWLGGRRDLWRRKGRVLDVRRGLLHAVGKWGREGVWWDWVSSGLRGVSYNNGKRGLDDHSHYRIDIGCCTNHESALLLLLRLLSCV